MAPGGTMTFSEVLGYLAAVASDRFEIAALAVLAAAAGYGALFGVFAATRQVTAVGSALLAAVLFAPLALLLLAVATRAQWLGPVEPAQTVPPAAQRAATAHRAPTWSVELPSDDPASATAVGFLGSDGIVVAGEAYMLERGDPPSVSVRGYVARLTRQGGLVWMREFPLDRSAIGSLVVLPDDSVVVMGDRIDPGAPSSPLGPAGIAPVLARFTPDGGLVWARQLTQPAFSIAGHTRAVWSGEHLFVLYSRISASAPDALGDAHWELVVAVIDRDGTTVWERELESDPVLSSTACCSAFDIYAVPGGTAVILQTQLKQFAKPRDNGPWYFLRYRTFAVGADGTRPVQAGQWPVLGGMALQGLLEIGESQNRRAKFLPHAVPVGGRFVFVTDYVDTVELRRLERGAPSGPRAIAIPEELRNFRIMGMVRTSCVLTETCGSFAFQPHEAHEVAERDLRAGFREARSLLLMRYPGHSLFAILRIAEIEPLTRAVAGWRDYRMPPLNGGERLAADGRGAIAIVGYTDGPDAGITGLPVAIRSRPTVTFLAPESFEDAPGS